MIRACCEVLLPTECTVECHHLTGYGEIDLIEANREMVELTKTMGISLLLIRAGQRGIQEYYRHDKGRIGGSEDGAGASAWSVGTTAAPGSEGTHWYVGTTYGNKAERPSALAMIVKDLFKERYGGCADNTLTIVRPTIPVETSTLNDPTNRTTGCRGHDEKIAEALSWGIARRQESTRSVLKQRSASCLRKNGSSPTQQGYCGVINIGPNACVPVLRNSACASASGVAAMPGSSRAQRDGWLRVLHIDRLH
jgi:hypothetical protein